MGALASLCVGLALLAVPFGRWVWWLDLPNHFPQVAALGALVGACAFAAHRSALRATALLVVAVGFGARWQLPHGALVGPEAVGRQLRVVVANVYTPNPHRDELVAWIVAQDPDVIGLIEVDDAWMEALGPLRARWPHRLELPHADNFGVAVYSRSADVRLERVSLGQAGLPSIRAELGDGGALWFTHPPPPIGATLAAARNAHLADVAEVLREPGAVVLGDLNVTPWSAHFPADQVVWQAGTWPASLPAPLRIPIDHVLTGPGVGVRTLRVGPPLGSDHRALVVTLVMGAP